MHALTPAVLADSQRAASIESACIAACEAIAPAWPLDRALAVNPHWGRINRPLRTVAARMAVLGGIRVLPARRQLAHWWQQGRLQADDLAAALAAEGQPAAMTDVCIGALATPLSLPRLPLLIDVLDDERSAHRMSWRAAVTHQVSQTCAAYFDREQADWQPDRREGLYGFWRDTLSHDHGIGVLMGLPALADGLRALPPTRADAEAWALERLALPSAVWADYLEAVLLSVNGWASWCAFLGWEARLRGEIDLHLRELLAIRLAWGAVLLECQGGRELAPAFTALTLAWQQVPARLAAAEAALLPDEIWQRALEIGYQRQLRQQLASVQPAAPAAVEAQAVFCIDVRSERLRRALEQVWPGVETRGFAGFFGLPIAYTPLGTQARRPQLPGLLAPALEAVETVDAPGADAEVMAARARHLGWSRQWQAGSRWPAASFSYVEAAGLGYLGKLWRFVRPAPKERPRDELAGLPARWQGRCRPVLADLPPEGKVALAAQVLRAMGLTAGFAPLVVVVGHGSQSANNPQAAALDCGACGGQTGEVNARLLAALLNEPAVHAGLAAQGIVIPETTHFVAALHNTTTDETEFHDADRVPAAWQAALARCQAQFAAAGARTRQERAPALGLAPGMTADALLAALRRRASDSAETRPEWGLVGNAAFLIAPRARSRGCRLHGRVFLHDYDATQDADGRVLELLMTAPMVVTHWINWQYHASVCEPLRYGSGNKVLHNVVGGHLGVFEGNGGDLRIGLAQQSLHDGRDWQHEPLRLTVIIDAPAAAIDRVLAGHATVRQLVEHGWLHLWRFADDGFEVRQRSGWQPVPEGLPTPSGDGTAAPAPDTPPASSTASAAG